MRRTIPIPLVLFAALSAAGIAPAAPPLPPDSCWATDSVCARVIVGWKAPPDPVLGYAILRDGDPIGSGGPNDSTFLDTTAPPNSYHEYAVLAWNVGYSAPCVDSGRSLAAPAPPASFNASRDLCERVRLAWTPPPGAAPLWGYRIVAGSLPGGRVDLPPDSLGYTDASPIDGAVYTIRSFNCEESAGVADTGRVVFGPPAAPSACSAELETCSSVRLSWSRAADAIGGYVVFLGEGVLVDSLGASDTSLVTTPLPPGEDRLFRVFSRNDCGRSALPCSASIRVPGPIGGPPPGSCSASTDSCAGIWVRWTWASPDIEWYHVVRARDGVRLDSVGAEVRSFFDGSVAAGDTVRYLVRAGNRCYVSAAACTTLGGRPAIPSSPQQCSVTDDRCGVVRVSWVWPYITQDIQGFRVYRRNQETPSSPPDVFTLTPPPLGSVTLNDSTAVPGDYYRYRIVAYSECGESQPGCEVLNGFANSPPAIGLLQSPADGATGLTLPVRLTWQPRARATSYRLEVATDAAFAETFLDTSLAGASFDLARVEAVGDFYWRVRAANACGEGPLYPARTFNVPSVEGLTVVSGSTSLPFGNGSDTTFSDSVLVLENRWAAPLSWIIEDTLSWIDFRPPTGVLLPGAEASVTVSVGEHRCGVAHAETLRLETDPVVPGEGPIELRVSLLPEPRPAGDVDWDCVVRLGDAARVFESLLGAFFSTAAESAGADANADGRINVADVVFLATGLLDAPPSGPEKSGPLDLSFGGESGNELHVSTNFPIRAVRFLFAFPEGSGGRLEAADRERGIFAAGGAGEGGVFWASGEGEGSAAAPLLRFADGAAAGAIEGRWIEIAGAGDEVLRLSLGGRRLAPSPPPVLLLEAVRPNPFNGAAVVRFALPGRNRVRLAVYDVRGSLVRVLIDGTREAGAHEAFWAGTTETGREAASGVYFLRLETPDGSAVRRVHLVR